MEIITPEIKDKVLSFLVENCEAEQLSQGETRDFLNPVELSFNTFNAIMNQFERLGLVSDLNLRHSYSSFVLLTDAHDLKQKGGFVIQEEVFQTNLNKLLLEIEALKEQQDPVNLDKLSKISAIASLLLAGLTFFKK